MMMKKPTGEFTQNLLFDLHEEKKFQAIIRKLIKKTLNGSMGWRKTAGSTFPEFSSDVSFGEVQIRYTKKDSVVTLILWYKMEKIERKFFNDQEALKLYRVVSSTFKSGEAPILDLFCDAFGVDIDDSK
ncbi:MAG: hypothetical protein KGL39_37650 [Patescibacteria group bacterium]|nr:hypothetical protein [Patescibacteria group bacterium]